MITRRRVDDILRDYATAGSSMAWLLCDRHPSDSAALRFVGLDSAITEVSYGELEAQSRRVASALRRLGIGQCDRVATLIGKTAYLPAILLGIWRIGAVYTPLFTAFSGEVAFERLRDAGVRAVFADEANAVKVAGGPWTVITPRPAAGQVALDEVLLAEDDGEPAVAVGGTGAVVHMFTSGTTGKPKAVVHPMAYAAGWHCYLEFGLGVRDDARYWSAADPGWAFGLYTAYVAPLAAGFTTTSVEGGFDVTRTWRAIERLGVTDFVGAPTIYRNLLGSAVPEGAPFDLRRLSSAGEPLTPEVNAWAEQQLGLTVHDHFGQTEIGMIAGFAHVPEIAAPVQERAMGRVLPGWEAAVIDDDGSIAPAGTVGRFGVAARSELMTFRGYFDDAADRFTRDGEWYLTGDLVTQDDEGILHFSSRDDDVIIMAGYRIGPFDIESILVAHPAVAECAVVALPDPLRGEVVAAFVVLTADATPSDALTHDLQALVRTRYANHAYPRSVRYLTSLPKTPSGKVKRAELKGVSGR